MKRRLVQLIIVVQLLTVSVSTMGFPCKPAVSHMDLDINDVRVRLNNGGTLWIDQSYDSRFEFPKDSGTHIFNGGAIWVGGITSSNQLYVISQTWINEHWSGPINQNGLSFHSICEDWDQMWKINRSTIDSFKAKQFTTQIPKILLDWPGKDNPNNPILARFPGREFAPYIDVNGDGKYDPYGGDYPNIRGDQAVWWVYNAGDGADFGMEFHVMAFACNGSDLEKRTTFYQYKLINRSNYNLDSTFVSHWVSPQIGCYQDDFIGCDTTRNMGIFYNGDLYDDGCGWKGFVTNPPMAAVAIVCGLKDQTGKRLKMSSFVVYTYGFGGPETAPHFYNLMNARHIDGSHITYFDSTLGIQRVTKFLFPGEPTDPAARTMCSSSIPITDYQALITTGPFKFEAGGIKKIIYVAVVNNSEVTYPCPSFSSLKTDVDYIRLLFDCNINLSLDDKSINTNEKSKLMVCYLPNNDIALTLRNPGRYFSVVEIFDLTGKRVVYAQGLNKGEYIIESAWVHARMYLYRTLDNKGVVRTGKLLISD
ncbi:MAG: hypothetical protein IIA45_09300 [Bacteroidetes bacterium]|nr:hypothetical protein [Bacteroidota bacterium]